MEAFLLDVFRFKDIKIDVVHQIVRFQQGNIWWIFFQQDHIVTGLLIFNDERGRIASRLNQGSG